MDVFETASMSLTIGKNGSVRKHVKPNVPRTDMAIVSVLTL